MERQRLTDTVTLLVGVKGSICTLEAVLAKSPEGLLRDRQQLARERLATMRSLEVKVLLQLGDLIN
jgi:hypothetical protein